MSISEVFILQMGLEIPEITKFSLSFLALQKLHWEPFSEFN